MALKSIFRILGGLGMVLALTGCGNAPQGGLTEVSAALVNAVQSNRNPGANITATRASLLAAGFSDPLIVIALPKEGTRGGLLRNFEKEGVTFWRSADGNTTVSLAQGVLKGTVGLGHDLYSAEAKETLAAILSGQSATYTRTYRHLNGIGELDIREYQCRIALGGRETITVFDRGHDTLRIVESCIAETQDAAGKTIRFENLYWRDAAGTMIWRSTQWISPELGSMTVERVF